MDGNELGVIISGLKEKGKLLLNGGATEEQINSFEEKSNIKLPLQYREWLKMSDGGNLFPPAGIQFYGVSQKPIIGDDPWAKDFPEGYYTIGTLSYGDAVLCKKDDDKIYIFNHETGKIEEEEVFPDFYSFLKNLPDFLAIED